jgi:thiol:disulfide interchange protein DsbA
MNRREFSTATVCLLGLSALGMPGLAWAQRRPEDGTDYRTLGQRVPVETAAGKVEVVEFFWYSCPHCNAFEPRLETWAKKMAGDVALRRVPVAFREDFVPQQRLFYTLEAMNRLDDLHPKVFQAIHGERNPLNKEASILAWAEKQGLDKAKFQETFGSFSVTTKARRAIQLQDAFKVEGVPALGIAGRYYTDATLAGSMDRALQVAEYLIAEARRSR